MHSDSMRRRRVLGGVATALAVGLAGCASGSADSGDGGGGGTGGSADPSGWFDGVSNYDGVVDSTGAAEVGVAVGAQGNGGGYAFDPAAIRVDAGTTVTWEWTGDGGTHNVVDEDERFQSDLVSNEGHTFRYTFEEPDTFRYVCVPHEAMGMKGAVVVE